MPSVGMASTRKYLQGRPTGVLSVSFSPPPIVQYMTSEIFVHARHICIVAKTCLVACKNGVLPHAKKLFPFTMQGEQAYTKFKAPIETGLKATRKTARVDQAAQENDKDVTPCFSVTFY